MSAEYFDEYPMGSRVIEHMNDEEDEEEDGI